GTIRSNNARETIMSPTSLNEASLELLNRSDLSGIPVDDIRGAESQVREVPAPYDADWLVGSASDYDRASGLAVVPLVEFLISTPGKSRRRAPTGTTRHRAGCLLTASWRRSPGQGRLRHLDVPPLAKPHRLRLVIL